MKLIKKVRKLVSICHLLFLLLATVCSAEVSDNFLLNYRNFKIQSVVNRIGLADYLSYHVIEQYSVEQRRARIKFSQANTALEAPWQEFIYDSKMNTGLLFGSSRPASCQKESADGLISLLFDGSAAIRELLAESKTQLSHVIGPVRLLFHLIDKLSMWRQIPVDGNDLVSIRNHEVVIYEVILRDNDKQIATCRLLYDKASFGKSLEVAALSQLPLRVIVIFTERHEGAFIDYFHLKLDESALSSTDRHPMSSAGRQLDEFVFPVGRNCSQIFYQEHQRDLFENYDLGSIRFSFKGRSLNNNGESRSQFVAYDGLTSLMRVDTTQGILLERRRLIRHYSSLLDFRLNRQFTWVGNKGIADLDADKLLNKCLVTHVLPPEPRQVPLSLKLGSFLLGSNLFVYMGRGRVRGIEVSVYESYTRQMPFWFQAPLVYLDKRTQKFGYRQPGTRLNQTDSLEEPTTGRQYNVLVYLSETTHNSTQKTIVEPLMLELFDLDEEGQESRRRALLVRFHSFMWELNEAPSGEQAHELFNYHRACLTVGGSQGHFAQVELDLVGELDSAKSWLIERPKRQSAVASALRDSLDLSSLMSYELKTQIVANNTIKVSFRVVERPKMLYKLTLLGNGRRRYGTWIDSAFQLSGAKSPFDCLWLMDQSGKADQHQTIIVLYLETKQVCMMDQKLSLTPDRDLNQSTFLELSADWSGEIYRLDGQLDDKTSGLGKSLLLESKLSRLDDRLVILQNFIPNNVMQPIDENELRLRIKRLRLRNLNYLQHVGSDSRPCAVFEGFGFVSGQLVHEFELKQSGRTRRLSLAQCEAACLAELPCRSFSYCSRWDQATCHLAGVDLEWDEVGELLRSSELQRLAKGTRTTMTLADELQVELERDFQCELRNKLHMSMYTRGATSQVGFQTHRLFKVSNEEQCARRCFIRALRSMEKALELRKRMLNLLESEEQANWSNDLERLKRELSALEGDFCTEFFFLDGSNDPKATEFLEAHAVNSESGSTYCALYNSQATQKPKEENLRFYFDSYKFDLSSLYEKRLGVALAASNRTEEEEAALLAIARQPNEPQTLESYAQLQRATRELKRNFKRTISVSEPGTCASQCFFRGSGIVPTCRSFDLIENNFHTVCEINSISLEQLEQDHPLVLHEDSRPGVQFVHYEPRFGLLQRTARLEARLWLDCLLYSRRVVFHRPSWPALFASLLLLAACCSGLVLGAKLANKLAGGLPPSSMATAIVKDDGASVHYSSAADSVTLS